MRVLHFSDIHLREPCRRVPLWEWFGKRFFGGLNLLSGRWRRYVDAFPKLRALDRFRCEHEVDLVLCTGDYTALGTSRELKMARAAVAPLMQAPQGFVHVPGNHDIYTWRGVRKRLFPDAFEGTFATDLPEYLVEGSAWPIVRLIGDDVAVAAVDSAHPNPLPWRSSGRIPTPQIEKLHALLVDDRVRERFVFVMTHHAPRLQDGQPDRWNHGLSNAGEFLNNCAGIPRGAILCGHVHRRYAVHVKGVRVPLFCAGSATQAGRESFWVFDIDGASARAVPGRWAGDRYELDSESAVEL